MEQNGAESTESEHEHGHERGIGPGGTSLRAKLGQPSGLAFPNPFAMQLEQQDRKEQRVAATIAWSERNRTPPKLVAPVRETLKLKGWDRLWVWDGEDIVSKGIRKDVGYTGTQIRAAGFKLPVLVKTKMQRKPRAKRKGAETSEE